MALEIEDGTGLITADSYATAAELVLRAAAYGWTVPADEATQEVLLRRAAEAMNALRWRGSKTTTTQALAWPRSGVLGVDDDAIPVGIKNGQMALAAEIYADDIDPPALRKGAITKEKVDVLEVGYAEAKASLRDVLARTDRSSAIQFADYLARRGLFIAAIRA